MTAQSIKQFIEALGGIEAVEINGDTFFLVDPQKMFPFATIVTGDRYDKVSNLDRPGIFRLNFGVVGDAFRKLFGDAKREWDYTALDTLMPHPDYAAQYFVCVLNPDQTWPQIQLLLAESHAASVKRYAK